MFIVHTMSKRTMKILSMCSKRMKSINEEQQKEAHIPLTNENGDVEEWLNKIDMELEHSPKSDSEVSEIIPIQANICVSLVGDGRNKKNAVFEAEEIITVREPDIINDVGIHYGSKYASENIPENLSICSDSIKTNSFIGSSVDDPSYIPSEDELLEDDDSITMSDLRISEMSTSHTNDNPESIVKSASCVESSSIPCLNKDSIEDELQSNKSCEDSHIKKSQIPAKSVETVKKINYADKLNYCFYCDKDVTHFVRHIFTWHSTEITVQKILSLAPKSKARRDVITSLRKQGNFIVNKGSNSIRPVKRLNANDVSKSDDFLPCSHCLGYYKRKSLYRHTKKCSENPGISNCRQTAQSDGQLTLLAGELLKHDQLLSKELFPRMRADNINLIAKRDILICQYAYSYMKGRKSKGNIDFVRQNMRRLAKFLDFCRQQNPEIKHLIDILKPLQFPLILKGVNHIAKYNPETDMYESPTLAINFGTLLKKCCDLAYLQLIQKENTNEQRKDLKILKKLIQSQWADEVSAQAALNLNENKWNKQELLPLTSDLKKLNTFLQKTAKEAVDQLQKDEENFDAYNTLKEVIYTQIILLNRKRPAEVAQLTIDKYTINDFTDRNGNTEFEKCLTETEKILINSYSRVVVRGKRGKGVPMLLSPDMKKHFQYFISIRNKFTENNKYVFHTSGQRCLDGTKTLYKYAKLCGAEKPKSINATKLRKHLATITQLLQFSDKDLEQLSLFMGHTLNTHCKVYRLSDSMYQTAKVSKLLLLMGEEGIEQYKGKNIDEIDLDLSPVIEEDLPIPANGKISEEDQDEESCLSIMSNPKIIKQKAVRQPWTQKQKKIIANFFSDHIEHKRSPKLNEVSELVALYPDEFKNRKWTSLKAVVFNMYSGKLNKNA